MAAWLIENAFEDFPCCVRRNVPVKLWELVHPFKDSDVGIGTEFVAVDARIGMPSQHLVISGIRECHTVCNARNAAFRLVAENLATLGDDSPQEWEEHPTTSNGVVAPELGPQFLGTGPNAPVLFADQIGIRPGKDLLPAQAIAHDENNISRLKLRVQRNNTREG